MNFRILDHCRVVDNRIECPRSMEGIGIVSILRLGNTTDSRRYLQS